jgi:hypothetical protein
LLELGCQTTNRRFWWNFTTGQLAGVTTTETRSSLTSTADARVLATACAASNGAGGMTTATAANGASPTNGASATNGHASAPRPITSQTHAANGSNGSSGSNGSNGHSVLAAVPLAQPPTSEEKPAVQSAATPPRPTSSAASNPSPAPAPTSLPEAVPQDTTALREAFLRQLQLDRLTMRQMRGWLMADEARRAAEVAGSATEATYERLALALFGVDLPQLLGRAAAVPPSTAMSAEERLELQREKARIRARQRRAAIKAARLAKED